MGRGRSQLPSPSGSWERGSGVKASLLQRAQVLAHGARFGVVRPVDAFEDAQGALEVLFGGLEVAEVLEHASQVVDEGGHVRMIRAKLLLE